MSATPAPVECHGGNRLAVARRLGCRPERILDASASLVPFGPPRRALGVLRGRSVMPLRDYPDRSYDGLRRLMARQHGIDPDWVLPGNGAAELFTWAARDAAECGPSLLPAPGFADYRRALDCWGGAWQRLPLPLVWGPGFPAPFPLAASGSELKGGRVLWLTNPHNPTGQLWDRTDLESLLERFQLVIADEAFLPLVAGGEEQSLIRSLTAHPNLVVIRSLTKLFAIAGLRLGYAVGHPDRLRRWGHWRDPWPVNGLAVAVGEALLADRQGLERWTGRVQDWVMVEGSRLAAELRSLPGMVPMPSAANFLLVRARGSDPGGWRSMEPLRQDLERKHRILVRDCRSFPALDETWLRIGLQDRRGNRRLLRALRQEFIPTPPPGPSGVAFPLLENR